MTTKTLRDLTPTSFENLCFDIVRDMAFHNPTWRTPGADGGRDIEAWRTTVDPTSTARSERWFIECKQYSSSIGWPLLYEKIAHADALDADYLFILTTSSASATCVDRIDAWNKNNKRPTVRIWGGHDINSHLSIRPNIKIKHGLKEPLSQIPTFDDVSLEIAKAVSTVHSLSVSDRNISIALEYANILARCWMERVDQLKNRGEFFRFPRDISVADFQLHIKTDQTLPDLSRGELLIILWILFVTENSSLQLSFNNVYFSISLKPDEFENILGTSSHKAITYVSSASLSYEDGLLIIKEEIYG